MAHTWIQKVLFGAQGFKVHQIILQTRERQTKKTTRSTPAKPFRWRADDGMNYRGGGITQDPRILLCVKVRYRYIHRYFHIYIHATKRY